MAGSCRGGMTLATAKATGCACAGTALTVRAVWLLAGTPTVPSTCRRPALLLRGRFVGDRGRQCRQDFPLGRKPMLSGLAVHAAMCLPEFVSALADSVFQAVIHVRRPCGLMLEPS